MIKNSELRFKLIKSELVQMDLADKEAIRDITERFGYTDIRTIDYISDCIRTDLRSYFN